MPKNWKMFKIIERKHWEKQNPEYIYFDLNIWFWFANDKSNTICCVCQEPFKDWKAGDIIEDQYIVYTKRWKALDLSYVHTVVLYIKMICM